jgi:CRP/FNR family transcriptional regulator, anaerobic regulatory protein
MTGFSSARFSALANLSHEEEAALKGLAERKLSFSAKRIIRLEGEAPRIFLLLDGWAASFVALLDGRRQFLKLHLSGDVMGAPSLPLLKAADSLIALTDCTIAEVSKAALATMFEQHPRLAMVFFLAAQQERIILMDRLISISRTNARQRVAAFLLHLQERLSACRNERVDSFELLLTQEQIGDMVGLTSVHVNRVLRELTEAGCIRRTRRWVFLIDLPFLRSLSGLPERKLDQDAAWLPSRSCA